MTSYPFIESLFKNILVKSRAIQGRFYICPRWGQEVNNEELEQVIRDTFENNRKPKYPLALLMPPRSQGNFTAKAGEWEKYHFVMLFLTTTYASSTNMIKNPNQHTGTSQHTIPEDWHDMKRAAVNFIRMLESVMRIHYLHTNSFRIEQQDKTIDPVSLVGKDRLSGVKLEFNGSLFVGCELEDYNTADINSIIIPDIDSHLEHKL